MKKSMPDEEFKIRAADLSLKILKLIEKESSLPNGKRQLGLAASALLDATAFLIAHFDTETSSYFMDNFIEQLPKAVKFHKEKL